MNLRSNAHYKRRLEARCRRRVGQAMVEFMIVMAILLSSVAIVNLFLNVYREHGMRVLRLVASEYP